MRTITTWKALMMYAAAEGAARKSGDPERIEAAKKACDDYAALCLEADEMWLDCTYGDLSNPRAAD